MKMPIQAFTDALLELSIKMDKSFDVSFKEGNDTYEVHIKKAISKSVPTASVFKLPPVVQPKILVMNYSKNNPGWSPK